MRVTKIPISDKSVTTGVSDSELVILYKTGGMQSTTGGLVAPFHPARCIKTGTVAPT